MKKKWTRTVSSVNRRKKEKKTPPDIVLSYQIVHFRGAVWDPRGHGVSHISLCIFFWQRASGRSLITIWCGQKRVIKGRDRNSFLDAGASFKIVLKTFLANAYINEPNINFPLNKRRLYERRARGSRGYAQTSPVTRYTSGSFIINSDFHPRVVYESVSAEEKSTTNYCLTFDLGRTLCSCTRHSNSTGSYFAQDFCERSTNVLRTRNGRRAISHTHPLGRCSCHALII